jgi:CAAX prenyl protease-like protein
MACHIVPFLLWVGVMSIPMSDVAIRYSIQVFVSLVAFLVMRPWYYYPALDVRFLPLSCLVGVGVAVIWILPESLWIKQYPGVFDFYSRYFIRGDDPGNNFLFAPGQCGWFFTLIRFAGSAFVIAVIEEYFWRGFVMRWLVKSDFVAVEPAKVGMWVFWITAVAFGFEHNRWLVGILAGLAYGQFYRWTGNLLAVAVAHVVTNLLLGIYVLATGAYYFW